MLVLAALALGAFAVVPLGPMLALSAVVFLAGALRYRRASSDREAMGGTPSNQIIGLALWAFAAIFTVCFIVHTTAKRTPAIIRAIAAAQATVARASVGLIESIGTVALRVLK